MADSETIDFTALTQAQWERNCQFSAAMIVVFEYFLQFSGEIDLFWSRYYGLAFNIGNAAAVCNPLAMKTCILTSFQLYKILSLAKRRFYPATYHNSTYLGASHAMYGRSKKVLAFLILMLLTEIAGLVILLEVPIDGLVGTNNPSLDLFICADADPAHKHWIAYAPMMLIIVESILLSLALFKAHQQRKIGITGGRILPQLMKESVFFFAAIFGVHLGNLIIWMVNNLTTNELFTGYAFAIPSVLANRLLISVREQVPVDTAAESRSFHVHSAMDRGPGRHIHFTHPKDMEPQEIELRRFRIEVGEF
ncbi:hypothetical protein MVEN_02405300 [Mycena venus]|uniref:Uncharacterized protein n=1 Tax=Mycena venus TaxID=2733690 RepID=A0A8H6X2J7_9AGAR|nr:hypothetical protein MVEN_02405300 [Mycena venus]